MKLYTIEVVCDSFVCDASRFDDQRGYFQELFSHKEMPSFTVAQINCSLSKLGVLRGLHVAPFGKLVYCVKGKIYDVVADLRKDSKTYLKWYGVKLSGENHKALYIPPHCGHGFLSLAEDSLVVYAQDGLYDPSVEKTIRYDDPKLNIKWPLPILSPKDVSATYIS